MSFAMARGLIAHLIAFAVVLQGVELLKMSQQGSLLSVWSKENLEAEFKFNLPLPLAWIEWFASGDVFAYLAWAEIIIGAAAFTRPYAFSFFALFLIHVVTCVRFRGSINGGSDSMTAMVLLGTWIAFLFKKESFASAGLVWIAVNVLISYARAAIAKLQQPEWRDGHALPAFLQQSFYGDIRAYGQMLTLETAKKLGWGVIALELILVASPLVQGTPLTAVFFIVVVFHFLNYWVFGLNRFFWAWIAAWPSIFYLSGLLHPTLQ
jgi:hypothetical protein